jgi:tetratricopeptide (TPR) repeat protein
MREMARSLNLLGVIRKTQGRYAIAAEAMRGALALHRELGDRLRVGGTLNNLGLTAEARGDYAQAAIHYQQALTLARDIKDRELEFLSLRNLGGAHTGMGDHQVGAQQLHQAIQIADSAGWANCSLIYSRLAAAYLGLHDIAAASQAAQQALALAHTPVEQGTAWRAAGLVRIEDEKLRIEKALLPIILNSQFSILNSPTDCFAESVRFFAEAGMQGERARTLREWARYEIARGNRVSGELLWREVRAVFVRLDMDGEVRVMDEFLAL